MEFSALLKALENPAIYPERPRRVGIIQTHSAAIFLAGEHVYKVKKPVNFGFLDFSTLERRKYFCEQEVILNRRLSPQIYLGVVPIRSLKGRILIGEGAGEVVEYAVLMKRLSPACIMDRRLARGAVTPEDIRRIAGRIAAFHARAETNPTIARFGELAVIRGNTEENFSQTEGYIGRSISRETFQETKESTARFLAANEELFQARIAAGRIRDCHGDLHLEHICLNKEIVIFDCIEFNERFRYSDVASDLAFLLMDLDSRGHPGFSAELAVRYLALSRDWPLFLLLDFYKSYRAYVRGKVASFRLEDPAIPAQEKAAALEEARGYFRLAGHYAGRLNRPFLLVICGLMGTGKTTLARALSAALPWAWLSSDVIRKELASIPPGEARREKFQEGIYSAAFSRRTYRALLAGARLRLAAGKSVILDASFKKQEDRGLAMALAQEEKAEFLLVECRAPQEIIHERLAWREAKEQGPSDGRWELLADQVKDFDPFAGLPPDQHLILENRGDVEEGLGEIIGRLLRNAAREVPPAKM